MSFREPIDLRDESLALHDLVAGQGEDFFGEVTQFRGWTVDDVLSHLHFWNVGADLAVQDGAAFAAFYARIGEAVDNKRPLPPIERDYFGGLRGRALLDAWREQVLAMADRIVQVDPRQRVQWAGPPMSVRSSISARLMETWAHGQAIYDLLGVERIDTDRIRSIAVLGVNTFGWSFANRRLEVPVPPPRVTLTAPSGAVWSWNDENGDGSIEGRATEFCQVVSQVRNVADVSLRVVGETAHRWMEIAQCFAGPPRRPPAPGKRFRVSPGQEA